MNKTRLVLALALMGMAADCANLPRSRDTANPEVLGETLALQVCSNCHGVTGNSISPNFPNLAKQSETYLVAQMHAFRGHSRQDPAGFEYMWGLSRKLTDKQIEELASYYAGSKLEPLVVKGKPDRIEAGKSIFTAGIVDQSIPACSTCHGPDGMGNAAFPRIAGQHSDYLVKQLNIFQRTDQRPEGNVMKTVAHGLTEQNIVDVSEYLQAMTNP